MTGVKIKETKSQYEGRVSASNVYLSPPSETEGPPLLTGDGGLSCFMVLITQAKILINMGKILPKNGPSIGGIFFDGGAGDRQII